MKLRARKARHEHRERSAGGEAQCRDARRNGLRRRGNDEIHRVEREPKRLDREMGLGAPEQFDDRVHEGRQEVA